MKILFFAPTGLTSKQIGLTTEVLEHLADQGHEMMIVRCNAKLQNCFFNRAHNPLACASCQSREGRLLSYAGIRKEQTTNLTYDSAIDKIELPYFKDYVALKLYTYDGINIGKGIASSIISHTRDYDISSATYPLLIETESRKAINVTHFFKKVIKEYQPQQVYLFNGRFAEVYPLVALSEHFNIPYNCIEAGAKSNYHIFENCLPHSIVGRNETMNKIWNNTDAASRIKDSKQYYESKRHGGEQFEKSYTRKQIENSLPDTFDSSKKNVIIFNSSEDEVKTIDEWQHNLYNNQNEVINELCSRFLTDSSIHIYLRVHPNLAEVNNRQLEEINKMSHKNLTIISPKSPISSYNLMEYGDKIITFGSTMGAEATYWGKVSILYGKSFYMHTDCAYLPLSMNDLIGLIQDQSIKPRPKSTALKYGLFLTKYGKSTIHFSSNGLNHSSYKGRRIKKLYPSSIIYIMKYVKYWTVWYRLFKVYFGRNPKPQDILKYK